MIKQLKGSPIFAMHFVKNKLLYLIRENKIESITRFERVSDMNEFVQAIFPQSLDWKETPHWYVQLESGRYFIMQNLFLQHPRDRLIQDLSADYRSDLILTFDNIEDPRHERDYSLRASIDGNVDSAIANQYYGKLAEKVHKHYQSVPIV